MVVGSDWRIGPSGLERSAASTTAAMAAAAETLQRHLEFVLDDRVGSLTPDQRRFLNVALRHGDRVVRLVEDMRTIALAESGELEVVWSHFDLAATAHAVAERMWPVAHVEGKRLEVEHEGPVWVDGDDRRIGRALEALVADAVEVAEPGSAVRLSARDGAFELTYEGDEPPSETALALAEAVAGLHAGSISIRLDGGNVGLALRLETRPALTVAA
jgi:two-component system, OmpR family, sensor histidine kinase AdeS